MHFNEVASLCSSLSPKTWVMKTSHRGKELLKIASSVDVIVEIQAGRAGIHVSISTSSAMKWLGDRYCTRCTRSTHGLYCSGLCCTPVYESYRPVQCTKTERSWQLEDATSPSVTCQQCRSIVPEAIIDTSAAIEVPEVREWWLNLMD